jgi:hypothetical protein
VLVESIICSKTKRCEKSEERENVLNLHYILIFEDVALTFSYEKFNV